MPHPLIPEPPNGLRKYVHDWRLLLSGASLALSFTLGAFVLFSQLGIFTYQARLAVMEERLAEADRKLTANETLLREHEREGRQFKQEIEDIRKFQTKELEPFMETMRRAHSIK